MSLLVMPSGARYWRLKYRFAGREKQISLGTFPKVTLEDARLRCEQARQILANGTDPSTLRKQERAAKKAADARPQESTKFTLDSDGALFISLSAGSLTLVPADTAALRAFLNATKNVIPKVNHAPD